MARIVVGVDGSPGSRRALEWAVAEARTRGAVLEAVMAWDDPYLGTMWTAPTSDVVDAEAIEQRRRKDLDDVVDSTDASGLVAPIERTFSTGSPAKVLLSVAAGADMLVVGTRGHGAFVGAVLGSVSHRVAAHAPCPVVIVPLPHEG